MINISCRLMFKKKSKDSLTFKIQYYMKLITVPSYMKSSYLIAIVTRSEKIVKFILKCRSSS